MVIGGPALVYYVTPTEEQLFLKYNPELQKRSLENRAQKEQDFEDFVQRLKVYSKSDKHSTFSLLSFSHSLATYINIYFHGVWLLHGLEGVD